MKKLNIHILGINYYPEPTGISVYTTEMAEYLLKSGHKVTVFTGFPYYPQWKLIDIYRRKYFMTEDCNGVKIRRSHVFVPKVITWSSRILHELLFMVSSFLNLLFSEKPDILITISPSLGLGAVAYIISRIKSIPFIFHIQDLQPDAAVKLKMIENKILIYLLYLTEKFIYKKSVLVSVISDSMLERVVGKGIPRDKIVVFPNWIDVSFIKPLQKNNSFRKYHKIEDKFVVLYSGNMGVKQGLEIILEAAKSFKNNKDVLFLIVGDGAQKSILQEKARELNLLNVKFLPPQPKELLPEMLSSADISLVIQRKTVTDFAMPSKMLGILASGTVSIVSADRGSELYKIIKMSESALIVEPENIQELKDSILRIYNNQIKGEVIGRNARLYACNYLSKDKILSEFENRLTNLIDRKVKIAIVHDYLNQYGGAERVVETLHEIFPDAPIFTSIYLPKNLTPNFKKMSIKTSFMQKLPFLNVHFRRYLLLYPRAIESFNLKEYDIILSSSSAFAKGVRKGKNTCHICYCYTPMRFAWRYDDYVKQEQISWIIKKTLPLFIIFLKKWDIRTNKRVDYFIATCKNIKKRIEETYSRDAEVIYPPVNTSSFKINNRVADYFLVVSRLNAYKRIDIVVKAFNRLGFQLRIIGDGPYRDNLEKIAKSNIIFLGKVPDRELVENYSRCQASIFPGEEDFGIVPLEALASGRPVIAYAKGGSLETIIENTTGIFFHEQTPESLIEAINKFCKIKLNFDSNKIRETALLFDKEIFKRKISEFVITKYEEYKKIKSKQ